MWGFANLTCANSGPLEWGIFDPQTMQFVHRTIEPAPAGEMFCSAHAWTRDGRLVVAGGTSACPGDIGSNEVYVFDPNLAGFPNGLWIRQNAKLLRKRYYPTVIASTDGTTERFLVIGGGIGVLNFQGTDWQDYESFVPAAAGQFSQGSFEKRIDQGTLVQWFAGPSDPLVLARSYQYARVYQISTGQQFVAGMQVQASRAFHPAVSAASWTLMALQPYFREYGSSVRFPNFTNNHEDTIVVIGGSSSQAGIGSALQPLSSMQWCRASAPGPGAWPIGWDWSPVGTPCGQSLSPGALRPLNHPRASFNVTILPNGGLLAVGGQSAGAPWSGGNPTPVLIPELYEGGCWSDMEAEPSMRDYHSTSLLLPNGYVYSGGGEHRTADFGIFVPPKLACGDPRPSFGDPAPPSVMTYNTGYAINFKMDEGSAVTKVVLMRPGSQTHHWDADQQYVEMLATTAIGAPTLTFTTPANYTKARQGYWMMFLVSNQGVWSEAHWVQLP